MISEWKIENFKSIKSKTNFNLSPLTFFVGQNSAGKSTVIQSMLLTAQTLQSNASSRSVVLNGRILRLGSFSDICSFGVENNSSIEISFNLEKSPLESKSKDFIPRNRPYFRGEKIQCVSVSYKFSAGIVGVSSKELQTQPRLESGTVIYRNELSDDSNKISFDRHSDDDDVVYQRIGVLPEDIRLDDFSPLEFTAKLNNSASQKNTMFRRAYRLPKNSQIVGVKLRHFLPVSSCISYDIVTVEVDSAFEALTDVYALQNYRSSAPQWVLDSFQRDEFKTFVIDFFVSATEKSTEASKDKAIKAINLLSADFSINNLEKAHNSLTNLAKRYLVIQMTESESNIKNLIRSGASARKVVGLAPLPDSFVQVSDYVVNFFSESFKYLGPLRDEPKVVYPLLGYNDPKDIGFRGEFTAAVLDDNRHQKISYIPSASFESQNINGFEIESASLESAVKDWLSHLGIAKNIDTEDRGTLGHRLAISTTNNNVLHDLTHVGVGVSQALPIVVLSLLANPGSTLVFEQPELHLNPRVQTRLADFFVSLILTGKQCIIETHSEYLISRVRLLVALSEGSNLSENIKIYFVEKPNLESKYREVTISDTGAIKNWPEGFFDETEKNAEAIIRAQMKKSLAKRNLDKKDLA